MRKIEEKMVEAIKNRKNWACDNTIVEVNGEEISVKLHFHPIAKIKKNFLTLSSCGYMTKTTKSRLNAILRSFNKQGVYQKDFVWYMNSEIFYDGMVVEI
jgi:hypothetical protein